MAPILVAAGARGVYGGRHLRGNAARRNSRPYYLGSTARPRSMVPGRGLPRTACISSASRAAWTANAMTSRRHTETVLTISGLALIFNGT